MSFADPEMKFRVRLPDGTFHQGTVFLSAILDHPRIEAGAYSYASSHQPFVGGADVAARLAPYLYPLSPEKLIIGKFCQIAHGVQFITSSANHRFDGVSSFPFFVLESDTPDSDTHDSAGEVAEKPSMPAPGRDTIIGHDVWIGTGAMILPGAQIGGGAIIGAGAVVAGKVPPYTVFAGNRAQKLRARFPPDVAERLQKIAWWDWPVEQIVAHEREICGGDVDALAVIEPV